MIYKVSYVILGGKHKGGIKNQSERPHVGDQVRFGRGTYRNDRSQGDHAAARRFSVLARDRQTGRAQADRDTQADRLSAMVRGWEVGNRGQKS